MAVNEDGPLTDPSAMLDIKTTEKAFLPPRLTSMQRDNINSPAEDLTIYNSDHKCLEWWDGEGWFSACWNGYWPNCGDVYDYDGNKYSAVIIGDQCWMRENLKTTHYRNGTAIVYPGSNNTVWETNNTGAYAWYNNDIGWKGIYGAIYNYYAVANSNGLCPAG